MPMSDRIDPDDDPVVQLTDMLMACPSASGRERRRSVLSQLERRLGYTVPQPTDEPDRIDVYRLAEFCWEERDERLPVLAKAIEGIEGRSDPLVELERCIARLLNPGVLDAEPLARLREILGSVLVPEAVVRRLYSDSVGTLGPALPSARLADVIERLNDLMPPAEGDVFPSQLIAFVERLADYLGNDDPAVPELRRWVPRTVASNSRALEVRLSEVHDLRDSLGRLDRQPVTNWYLLVEFRPISTAKNRGLPPSQRRYSVTVGLMAENEFVPDFRHEVRRTSVDDAKVPVNHWINEALAHMQRVEASTMQVPELTIEMFVPLELLCYPFDRWGSTSFDGRELGQEYPMVIRGLDRRALVRAWRYWKQRWIWKQRHPADQGVEPVRWLTDTTNVEGKSLLNEVTTGARNRCIGLGISFPPARQELTGQLLEVGLEAGFPVMMWTRSGAMKPFRDTVHHELGKGRFPELPSLVLRLRSQAGGGEGNIGSHLVLLWDDPFRPPPDRLQGPRVQDPGSPEGVHR
jgi:hypothetical protein